MLAQEVIKSALPGQIWVRGEIQDYNNKKDKPHVFFNFVQKDPHNDTIVAQTTIVIFESIKAVIAGRLKNTALPFELKDGIEVQFLCRADFYAKAGRFQLVVTDIEPAFTIGKVAQNRQRIIDDLKARGLLEKNKQLALSQLPIKLGLITSFDSAAYHDFTNELKLSGFGFKVFLYNCRMQGDATAADVVRAINYFNHLGAGQVDAVVVTRGGGSTADLAWFDDKNIAQSIAMAAHPVVTALGHEINTTIADLIAHTSLKTPTKAAQFFVERLSTFIEELDYLKHEIFHRAQSLISIKKERLQNSGLKVAAGMAKYFAGQRSLIAHGRSIILSCAKAISLKRKELEIYSSSIVPQAKRLIEGQKKRLMHAQEKALLLDPHNVLKRGYSITRSNTKVIKDLKQVKPGDILITTIYNGDIISTVKKE